MINQLFQNVNSKTVKKLLKLNIVLIISINVLIMNAILEL